MVQRSVAVRGFLGTHPVYRNLYVKAATFPGGRINFKIAVEHLYSSFNVLQTDAVFFSSSIKANPVVLNRHINVPVIAMDLYIHQRGICILQNITELLLQDPVHG